MDNTFKLYSLEKKDSISIENDDNLLMVVLSGNILLVGLDENKVFELNESITLLPTRSKVQINSLEKAKILTISFDPSNYFSVEYTHRLLSYSIENTLPSIDLLENLTSFFYSILGFLKDGINMTDLSELLRKELFIILQLYYSQSDISKLLAPILNADLAFKQIIMSNCLSVNNLDDLAALTKYSKSGFIKKFHRCFGISPYKWILEYKAKRIFQEVQLTNKRFSIIAEDHGISNLSYFYIFCKNHFGKSPSKIRKEGKKVFNL